MLCRVESENFRFAIYFGEFSFAGVLEELKTEGAQSSEILVFPFGTLPEIDLSRELSVAPNPMSELCKISEKTQGAVFCGVETRLSEERFIGAAVFFKGALVDIVNRTSNIFGDAYVETAKIKVFSLKAGRIGLLIDTDCLLAENWTNLAPACDVILCINRGNSEDFRAAVREISEAEKVITGGNSRLSLFPYLYVDKESVEWAGQ